MENSNQPVGNILAVITGEPDLTEGDPLGWKIVAYLGRTARAVLFVGLFWLVIFMLASLFAMTACTTKEPQPATGRIFHVTVAMGRGGSVCNGYVKPWIGHTYHFAETVGLVLTLAFVALVIAFVSARKMFGEKPIGPDLRSWDPAP